KLHRQIFLTGLHTAVIVPHLFEKGYNSFKVASFFRSSSCSIASIFSNNFKENPPSVEREPRVFTSS
ncbi:hypothetical protein QUB47_36400, partial [Microcoleus sp. AT9_B5]